MSSIRRTARRTALSAAALAAAAVVGTGAFAWPYTVDDAYVLARYARRIATGLGYTMNDGPPSDGVTGPLGLVPGILGELAVGDPVVAAKLVGLIAGALAAALVVRRAARVSSAEGWITLCLVSASPLLGVWSGAGLETGLATLAFTVAALSACPVQPAGDDGVESGDIRGGSKRVALGAGLGVAALAWLRPETAPAALLILTFSSFDDRRAGLLAWGLAGAGLASVVAFRLALFDAPLPLSASAKPPELAHGLAYVGRAALVVLGLGVVPLALARKSRGRLVAIVSVHVAAVFLAGGDWMPGFRLLVPVLPVAALAMAAPIAERWSANRMVAVGLLVASCAIPWASWAFVLPLAREAGAARETEGAELADWLAGRASRVALVDIGYLGYRSGLRVVDLGGITDPAVGRLPGGHVDKRIDPGWLRERSPDVILLHSRVPPRIDDDGRLRRLAGHPVEDRVAAMPWVVEGYRVTRVVRYSEGYWYIALEPRGR